jgi:hypothetical protein
MSSTKRQGRESAYSAIIERVFSSKYKQGATEFEFDREELARAARLLKIPVPKNLGDILYSFRYRKSLPAKIRANTPSGKAWILRAAGIGRYRFVLVQDRPFVPNQALAVTKAPDSTPGIIAKYALSDEQALLAKVRYNRLLDIFTGVACYSLQNHLRTAIASGQIETDEVYVGVDKKGLHYILPVQAKAGRDRLSIVQIEQDLALCEEKFRNLVCRPIGAQFLKSGAIALMEFQNENGETRIVSERHYQLVPPDEVTESDLLMYRDRLSD